MAKTHDGVRRTRAHDRKLVPATFNDEPILDDRGKPLMVDGGFAVADADLTELERVEREHGFTFGLPEGGHESAEAPRGVAVVCSNPDCKQVNVHVQLHTDTTLPVMCGACGRVLHCLHEDLLPVHVPGGTLGAPWNRTDWTCVACQTVVRSETVDLPPIKLEDIPVTDIPAAVAMAAARHVEGIV